MNIETNVDIFGGEGEGIPDPHLIRIRALYKPDPQLWQGLTWPTWARAWKPDSVSTKWIQGCILYIHTFIIVTDIDSYTIEPFMKCVFDPDPHLID